jgi:uncharacterized protein
MSHHLEAIIQWMLRPGFYAHPVDSVSLQQTHISLVFLAGPRVYKIKKPVDLGFLDFRTLEQRAHFCRREVELNQRLTRGVYLGVDPITFHEGIYRIGGGSGEIVEYAVRMRRLPADKTMQCLLAQGRLKAADIDELARVLSRFYQEAATGPAIDALGALEMVRYNCQENFDQTLEFTGRYIDARQHQIVRAAVSAFLDHRRELFETRVAQHKIRDGHGDLRSGHVYFEPDGMQIIDCIEFNERFRCGDVACDLAFLCMDLEYQGYAAAAASLVAGYVRHSGDTAVYGLLPFYKCYRAMVRTKVDCMRLRQGGLQTREERMLREQARRYMELAYRNALVFSRPRIWVVFGMIAGGKSTVAQALSDSLGVAVFNSDVVRKQLFRDRPGAVSGPVAFAQGIYSAEATALTYGKLLLTAQEEIDRGRSVILDATFSRTRHRDEARRLAHDMDAAVRFVECRGPENLIAERLRQRGQQATVSDARLTHLAEFKARFQPADEIPSAEKIVIDTSTPLLENIIRILSDASGPAPAA